MVGESRTPELFASVFECPLCHVVATQDWFTLTRWSAGNTSLEPKNQPIVSQCRNCSRILYWIDGQIAYPRVHSAPTANDDLPATVRSVYDEAAAVFDVSPRASCALLRLASEELLRDLEFTGSLDEMIGSLVKRGVPEAVQRSMDVLRVSGNESIHVGEIDLADTREHAITLFGLLNWIADDLITRPRAVEAAFGALPDTKKAHIERRDR